MDGPEVNFNNLQSINLRLYSADYFQTALVVIHDCALSLSCISLINVAVDH